MKPTFRPASLAWLALLAAAALWLILVASRQIARIDQVSDEAPAARTDDASPTGYAGGMRSLLLPVGAASGQSWIIDVQRMAAAKSWQAAPADYDNAPQGRAASFAPYRLWFRSVASIEAAWSGLPAGRAVERAALHAGPALHVFLALALGLFVAWRIGAASGALLGAGIAVLFVQAEAFAAGRLDERSLFLTASLAGVIALVAGLRRERSVGLLLLAGACSGLALWLDAGSELIVLGAWTLAVLATSLLNPETPLAKVARRPWAIGVIAIALAAIGWLAYRQHSGNATDATSGGSLWAWLRIEGFGSRQVAILLPLLTLPLAGLLWRKATGEHAIVRTAAIAAAILAALGAWQLRWWDLATIGQLTLLAVLVPVLANGFIAIGWRSLLAVLLVPAMALGWPRTTGDQSISPAEARALVERDLAQWLAVRSEPGAIAYAPAGLSASLCYYGGLRVITSPYPGNAEGRAFATRIAAVSSPDEAQALVQRRAIQYIVLPSWDDTLDSLARNHSDKPERSLIALLRQWLPPRWLRPVAYQMPVIPGLEQDSLVVFEVVEPQDNAVALSRLAEYFVETGRLELAAAVGDSLAQSFAADVGAMIARGRVAIARGESRTLGRILPELLPAIADGKDEDLSWERRASLALVLAQAKQSEQARHELEFCVQEADRDKLRSLGPVTLLRFLELARAMRLEFADAATRDYALGLLPAEFQAELAR